MGWRYYAEAEGIGSESEDSSDLEIHRSVSPAGNFALGDLQPLSSLFSWTNTPHHAEKVHEDSELVLGGSESESDFWGEYFYQFRIM